MIIRNVSNKIVGLTPDTSLLPNCETEVDDSMKGALEAYIEVGFLEVKESAVKTATEDEPTTEKPKSKSRKK